MILFLAYALNISYKTWQRFKFSKFKRQQAMQILQEDNSDIKKIRESIRLLSEAEYWPKNSSMSQWRKDWVNKYRVNDDFENLMNMLSAFFYSKKTITMVYCGFWHDWSIIVWYYIYLSSW